MTAADPEGRVRHLLDVMHKTFDAAGDPIAAGMVPIADGLGQVDYVDSSTFGSFPWFNVKDYGAVGNGSTDDTSAINLAIAALNTATVGVLYFPAATYKVTAALTTITATGTVLGDGIEATKLNQTSTTAYLLTTSAHGVTFRDFWANNTRTGTPTAGAAIKVTGGNLGRIENVLVSGFYMGIDHQAGTGWVIDGCFIENCDLYGIKVSNVGSPDAGDWVISNSYLSDGLRSSTSAIRVESSGGGKIVATKINGDPAVSATTGIDVAIPTGTVTGVLTVTGCSIENVRVDAIKVSTAGTGSYGNVVITGNEISLPNNTGSAVNISANTNSSTSGASGSIVGVMIDSLMAITGGTARAAVSLTKSDRVTLGAIQLYGFNARYTGSSDTNTTDTAASGAPTTADYLTGTAQSGLSAEIVVGTTPGGELGGTWASPTIDTTHSGSAHSAATGVTWTSGTSMPGSPSTNDRINRTDLGIDFYYDGTRWVCVCPHFTTFSIGNTLAPDTVGTAWGRWVTPSALDLWLIAWEVGTYVATTNNGTNFWNVGLEKFNSADSPTSIDSFTTAADSANAWTRRRRTLGVSYVTGSFSGIRIATSKTLSPGSAYFEIGLEYRLIGT